MSHGITAFALAFATALPLAAQEPAADTVRGGPTDVAELETFLDGVMEVLLDQHNTAGAVVSVVSNGEVFFEKGYGYADVEARTPVDPATTLFRIGSVSKLFVWTSVMQMVERGLIDLDTDINEYLDFEIPPTFPEPVTLSHIMGHAGGFEDWTIGMGGRGPDDLPPLGEVLAAQVPARVRPPGDISSYSNHASAMAAYMVERVSGTEWKEFVEQNIFEPLGMGHITFRQPLPESLAPDMSKGYTFSAGRYREQDFEIIRIPPAGAASASGSDMARFMIALLQHGRLGDGRIMSEETARLMLTEHHRMDPAVNAMAHGFMETSRNGERIIGHGGDTRLFHSNLALFPEHDLGVFVSFNSRGGGGARGSFHDAFLDHYFPVERNIPVPPEDFNERDDRFTGTYIGTRHSYSTFAKINRPDVTVSATARGTLRALNTHWVEMAPLIFEEEHGRRTLVFREAEDGSITHFFLKGSPIASWERVAAAEHPDLHTLILIVAIASIVLVLLSPVIGWISRRWYGVEEERLERIPPAARWTLRLAAILFGAGFLLFVFGAALSTPSRGVAPMIVVGLAFPLLAALATAAAAWFAVRLWRKREGRPTVRVLYSTAAVAFCLFLWTLHLWNLLGWHY